ncbi:DnaK suppressor protein [Buttiauxella agrestis]|uniref:DnaK suppressor protein n=1 Tax=Buttiauxella agrestis TaxID=82977 RepID=A0A381C6L0_9ENTR|nr:TraR/DksA family transcriptional regulator [Buttiauxella agrestis]SUW63525.1 DnaK suppressor protein [Buttiauxella agrestis]
MADSMDLVQQRVDEELARNIKHARPQPQRAASAFFCEECDAAIPEARRAVVPGVTHCITCQEIAELKNQHYKNAI